MSGQSEKGRIFLVRAHWSRPPWCREDWCHVVLPNGYRYYSRNESVVFDAELNNECWVRARYCWSINEGRRFEVRFLDYSGEGSLDSVSVKQVREIEEEKPADDK